MYILRSFLKYSIFKYIMVDLQFTKILLSRTLSLINPEIKYWEVLEKHANETKKHICDKYRGLETDIFGVFGRYEWFVSKYSKDTGKSIIRKTAKAIVRNRKIIVTGERIYYMEKGKINNDVFIIEKLNREIQEDLSKEENGRMGIFFSNIMGLIPHNAICLIDEGRSASTYEEGSFLSRGVGSAIGVIISRKKIKTCKHLSEIKNINYNYFKCNKNCHESRPKCFAKDLRINMTTTEPFIKNQKNFLIFVEDLRHIGLAVDHLISENPLIFTNP
jgi:hypothetical protein